MKRTGTFKVDTPSGSILYSWSDYWFQELDGVLHIYHRKSRRGQSIYHKMYNANAWVRLEGPER